MDPEALQLLQFPHGSGGHGAATVQGDFSNTLKACRNRRFRVGAGQDEMEPSAAVRRVHGQTRVHCAQFKAVQATGQPHLANTRASQRQVLQTGIGQIHDRRGVLPRQ